MTDQSGVDPNVKIPAAVLAAARVADDVHRNAYPTEEVRPDGETGQVATATGVEGEVQPPTTESPPLVPAESTTEAPAPDKKAEPENWEHAYKSMKGRHDRLQDQIRAKDEMITHLQGIVRTLQETKPPEEERTPREPASKLITPEDESDYGEDFLSVVGRKAKQEISPELEALRNEFNTIKNRFESVNQVTAEGKRERLFETLDERLGNWREININPDFMSWLQLPDMYSGAIRQELLSAAFEQNNAPRVLAFFQGFLSEEAAVDPAQRGQDTTGAETAPAKIPLETFAAPGRAKTTAAAAPVEKPLITRAQIAEFYADANAGKYRGKDAEKDRIEAVIWEAQREGRIR